MLSSTRIASFSSKIAISTLRGFATRAENPQVEWTPCPWLDGHHVVFGEVIKGMNVLKMLEMYGSESGMPKNTIAITDCGELKEKL